MECKEVTMATSWCTIEAVYHEYQLVYREIIVKNSLCSWRLLCLPTGYRQVAHEYQLVCREVILPYNYFTERLS
jgi:hypothetical protein